MRLPVKAMLLGGLLASGSPGFASEGERISACMEAASKKYSIHPYLLWAIAKTESSFDPRAMGKNTNGSQDIGLMQINSSWLPTLAKHGITRDKLLDPCVSIDVGGWILAHNFKQFGQNWRAVGAYNAKTEWKRVRYARKVEKNLKLAYQLSNQKVPTSPGGVQSQPKKTMVASSDAATAALRVIE